MKPHKCPVCDGKGKVDGHTCNACDKGVLWEPEEAEQSSEDALDLTYVPDGG